MKKLDNEILAAYLHGASIDNIVQYFSCTYSEVMDLVHKHFDERRRFYEYGILKSCNVISNMVHDIDARQVRKIHGSVPKTKEQIVTEIKTAKQNAYYIALNKCS